MRAVRTFQSFQGAGKRIGEEQDRDRERKREEGRRERERGEDSSSLVHQGRDIQRVEGRGKGLFRWCCMSLS